MSTDSSTEKSEKKAETTTSTSSSSSSSAEHNYVQFTWSPKYTFPGKNQPVIDYNNLSVYDMWKNSVKNFAEKDVFGFRTKTENVEKGKPLFSGYHWISYGEAGAIVDRIGSGLASRFNVKPKENIGIFMNNCTQWLLSDFAIHRQGCVSVPLYSTFGNESITYIINHAELRVTFCDSSVLSKLLILADQLPKLHSIIVVDKYTLTDEEIKILKDRSIDLIFWEELEAIGAKQLQPEVAAESGDLFSIIYTSGTTGDPKGVMHNNKSVLAATEVIHNTIHFPNGISNEVHYSYLPLAHVYERDISLNMMRSGSKIGFISGTLSNMLDDIKTLQPTFLVGVPRVFKRMYDKVNENVSKMGFLQRNLFQMALNSKLGAKEKGTNTWINWDSIVFKKLKEMLGGRCRFFLSAAAPIDAGMIPWLECAFVLDVIQAYGLTETFAGFICTNKDSNAPLSSIGVICDLTEVRLVDVPDMNYFHTDNPPRGEIVVKGETVFAGYYKNKELTDEVLASDGWFSTGDIGQLDPNGDSFTIIDRKKNMFKLAQGEYIAAEKLENIYGRSPGIAQIWVYGESGDNFIVAVVVPDEETFPAIAKNLGISGDIMSEPEKMNSPAAYKYFMDTLADIGKKGNLAGFEMVKGILIEPEPFSIENNLLTPSFKLIRNSLKMKYQDSLTILRKKIEKEMKANSKGKNIF